MIFTDGDFSRSLRELWRRVDWLGFGEEFSNPVSLVPSDEFLGLAMEENTTFEELYLCGLRNRDFNILLNGFSYFQFYKTNHGLRYAYYPNPLLGSSESALRELIEMREYVEEGVLNIEEYLQEIAEFRNPIQPPPIRYEYDPRSYVELRHPSAHFHIGFHSDNRWPCGRIYPPEVFGLLIAKFYFGNYWKLLDAIKIGDHENSIDGILERGRANSKLIEEEYFSEVERNSFHFI